MLTFDEKISIINEFSQLERHNVSLGRVNFQMKESNSDKKNVVYHLHPNGNGFVYTEELEEYESNDKGYTNIRDFSSEQLRDCLTLSIGSLTIAEWSFETAYRETWKDEFDNELTLTDEVDIWNVYAGDALDGTFVTYNQAASYLHEEGFKKVK
ncbi:MAG: hypothetical protein ACRCWQ_00570 [Bacilli bacterium]